jgi:hypothetical protein
MLVWYGALRISLSDQYSVLDYDVKGGNLHVEHAYPSDASPAPRVHIDVKLVLENSKQQAFANGAWINVIGYVQPPRIQKSTRRKSGSNAPHSRSEPCVQAVLLWDAGSVKIQDYEATMEKHRFVADPNTVA